MGLLTLLSPPGPLSLILCALQLSSYPPRPTGQQVLSGNSIHPAFLASVSGTQMILNTYVLTK